ncbi:nucleotidyltransferase domain-containing protein [Methylobacterium goesingense]|uniref:Nucleotidyltransferase n=1 Tax=Methylobacterium goesingense TaxID=243690 RepID=A0ABV2LB43_9HYPH
MVATVDLRVCPSPAEALLIAEAVFRANYADAAFAYVAGSIMRGQGTFGSDIDLVVTFDSLEAARRESFVFDSVPVEAFVHDPGTLAWFIDDDVSRGRPSILNMIAEGRAIGRALDRAEILRKAVSTRLSLGPPALTRSALDTLRYEITDMIDDLRGDRTMFEMLAVGATLYPKLAELALRGRNRWNGSGKWTPRLLAGVDEALNDRFDAAFRALFATGTVDPVIALGEAELAHHGGPLFGGDCRTAAASWRKA